MRLKLQFHPADRAIFAILLLAILVGAFGVHRPGVWPLLASHLALLAAYAAFALAAYKWERARWVAYVRPLVAMGTIFTLYTTCGKLGMAAMPYRGDAVLSRIDTWMFGGTNPTFYVQRWQTPGRVELFAFFYGLFIPYINLSLVLGALGRPPLERDQFLCGWVFTYCISYLGYLFVPSTGPGAYFAAAYSVQLQGRLFYPIVVKGTAMSGGTLGAFPSLHGGSSLYLCLFDLRTNRLRGLTYLPVVVMIYGATIMMRYHYVIDLVVGTIVAVSCTWLGRIAFLRWAKQRQSAGLPAIPGGEGDVLPDFPTDGRDVAAAVFSEN
jgi:hypothetical protein